MLTPNERKELWHIVAVALLRVAVLLLAALAGATADHQAGAPLAREVGAVLGLPAPVTSVSKW